MEFFSLNSRILFIGGSPVEMLQIILVNSTSLRMEWEEEQKSINRFTYDNGPYTIGQIFVIADAFRFCTFIFVDFCLRRHFSFQRICFRVDRRFCINRLVVANRVVRCIQIINIDVVVVIAVFCIDGAGIGAVVCGGDGSAGSGRIRGPTARLLSFISKFNHIERSKSNTLRAMIKQNKHKHLTVEALDSNDRRMSAALVTFSSINLCTNGNWQLNNEHASAISLLILVRLSGRLCGADDTRIESTLKCDTLHVADFRWERERGRDRFMLNLESLFCGVSFRFQVPSILPVYDMELAGVYCTHWTNFQIETKEF